MQYCVNRFYNRVPVFQQGPGFRIGFPFSNRVPVKFFLFLLFLRWRRL